MGGTEAWSADAIEEPIQVKYDGKDAANHEIELAALATSLAGIARIVGVTANFAATNKLTLHQDALSVRVMTRPPQAHCYEMWLWVQWAGQHPLISSLTAGLTVTLVTYVFNRAAGQKEEMRHLRGALDLAIKELGTRDQSSVDRLLSTIDKMADALRPAARKAVAPVGETASSLTIGSASGSVRAIIGAAEKEAICSKSPITVGEEETFRISITEMDMESRTCKVAFDDEPEARYPAEITDPAAALPQNRYVMAMASRFTIEVRAKPTFKDGVIDRLYISDAV